MFCEIELLRSRRGSAVLTGWRLTGGVRPDGVFTGTTREGEGEGEGTENELGGRWRWRGRAWYSYSHRLTGYRLIGFCCLRWIGISDISNCSSLWSSVVSVIASKSTISKTLQSLQPKEEQIYRGDGREGGFGGEGVAVAARRDNLVR